MFSVITREYGGYRSILYVTFYVMYGQIRKQVDVYGLFGVNTVKFVNFQLKRVYRLPPTYERKQVSLLL